MSLFDPNSRAAVEYRRQHRSPELRAQAIRNLELLVERYPNLRLGQLISNATVGHDLFNLEDDAFALALNKLFVDYTQLEAAGLKREKL